MSENALETKVGFFLMLGLATAAVMIIIFGRFEESFKPTYIITVKFSNAEGLLKGTTVTLKGSPIGRIIKHPQPIEDDGETKIAVDIRITKSVQIREDARFRIVSIGMLGDRGIDIEPRKIKKDETELPPFLKNGDVVNGESSGGGLEDTMSSISDLGSSAKPALDRIRDAAAEIKNLTARANTEMMTPEAIADFQESLKKLKSVLTRLDALLADAQSGNGALHKILKDPEMANNLADFIYNIRHKGILFYGDVAHDKEESESREKDRPKP